MKKFSRLSLVLLMLAVFLLPATNQAQIERPIGTNLMGLHDWNTEYVFVDVFNQSREWVAHQADGGGPWSSGVQVALRPDGYPLEIPYSNGQDPPQAVRTLMFSSNNSTDHYPGGYYRLMVAGQGQVRLRGPAWGTFQCPVDTLVWVDSTMNSITLVIDTSLAADPIHDIHLIMPGFHQNWEEQVYHPYMLEFLDDFQVIRYMDWLKTNNSPVVTWADRTPYGYYTQTTDNGVAYEHIIDLSNRLHKDPWICIPHQADDAYIAEMARFLRDSLDPCLTIYVEYSNEVWNSIFDQTTYARQQGALLGYTGFAWEQGWKFTAKRSADVFRIFEAEFVDDSRFVKVMPAQTNSWVTNYIMERFSEPQYNPTGETADAIAIAPYFGGLVADEIGNAGLANTITVQAILDSLENTLIDGFTAMDENQAVADSHGVMLLAYEGGQHLSSNNPTYMNNAAFIDKLLDANRDPRMETMYCEYFNHWYDSTQAGVFCNFSSHGNWGRFGAWGVKEYYEDTLSSKYQGLVNCVFSHNQVDAPIAVEDRDTLLENGTICIPVLANDSDPNLDSLYLVAISTAPSNGSASISNDTICYTPNPGFTGTDTLWYRVCDGECASECSTAPVILLVEEDNTTEIQPELEQPFRVYPNPAREEFTLELPVRAPQIYVYDLQGKSIQREVEEIETGKVKVRVAGFQGLAILVLEGEGKVWRRKIMLVR